MMGNAPGTTSLAAGARISHYEIVSRLGAGGMGEVYRARDTRLQREVALKLLPPRTASQLDMRQRFEREARAVAALNHPGIVTIHSVEDADGHVFLTMELVEGRVLAESIPPGGLPFDRLLQLAVPLADAVGAAHSRGITHRDLKPANVMVTPGGQVKVLDFGLAKVTDAPPGSEGAATEMPEVVTGEGRVVGTIAYMSPEQAEGRPVDARSDIFSLGVMLYEMATGERPFRGETSMSTMAAILRDTPRSVSDLNPSMPKELSRIIRRALAKDPERRQQSGKELRNELDDLQRELQSGELDLNDRAASGSATGAAVPSQVPPSDARGSVAHATVMPSSAPSKARLILAAAAIGAVVMAGVAAWSRMGGTSPAAATAPISVDSVISLTSEDGVERTPSIAPDGKWIVYSASETRDVAPDILLRAVGGQTVINLTKDAPGADVQPAFSADGERIAFRSERNGGGIFVMGRTGESVRRISEEGFNPSWSPDGSLLAYARETIAHPYGRGAMSPLTTVNVATGERRRLDKVVDAIQPSWSPHGHRIAYWGLPGGDSVQRDIWTVAVSDGVPVQLTNDAAVDWSPVWSPDGQFIYYSSDRSGQLNVWRIAIDEVTGAALSGPEAVTLPRQGIGELSFASDGRTLAAASFNSQINVEVLTWDAGTGVVTGRRRITNSSEVTSAPSASRDGTWVAFYNRTNGQEDIWVVRRDGSSLRRITNDVAFDRSPVWMPDGKRLLFYSNRGGRYQVWSIDTDGGDLRQVTEHPGLVIEPTLNRDGTRAVANVPLAARNVLFDPRLSAKEQRQPLEELPAHPSGRRFAANAWSPDGQQIVGIVAGLGIFVYDLSTRQYEGFGAGTAPIFGPDGKQLVFVPPSGRELHAIDLTTRQTRTLLALDRETIGSPEAAFSGTEIFAVVNNTQADVILAKLKEER